MFQSAVKISDTCACLCVSSHSLMTGWWLMFMMSLCVSLHSLMTSWWFMFMMFLCVSSHSLMIGLWFTFMMFLCVFSHSLMTGWWFIFIMSLCVSSHSLMTGWYFMFVMSLCFLAQLDDWLKVYVHDAPLCVLALPVTTNMSGSQYYVMWCDVMPCSLVHMHQCFIELCCFCLPSWRGRQDVPPQQWHTFIATWNHITICTAMSTSDLNKHITWNHQILDTDVPQFSNNPGVFNMVLCIFYCSLKMWLIHSSKCLVFSDLWSVLQFRSCVSEVTFCFKDTAVSSVP